MPLRVRARLTRPGGTYLAGETLHAEIGLQNDGDRFPCSPAAVAWCCCQVHCQAVASASFVKRDALPAALDGAAGRPSTAFVPSKGETGASAYSGRASVLCCNLILAPGETKQLEFSDTVTEEGSPPSFRGKAMSYHYKLTVGVQAPNAPVKMLRVPFRLLTILTTAGVLNGRDEGAGPANPFLCAPAHGDAHALENATMLIENVTCVRNKRVYDVAMERGRVGKLSLASTSYKLGDEVLGRFDFDQADVPCVQYLVSLEQIEEVTEEYRAKPDQSPARTAVWHFAETCLHAQNTEFRLPIPLSASPTFFTDALHVKWRLQFEFVLAADAQQTAALWPVDDRDGAEKTWLAPKSLKVETLVWHLPVKVFPCNPLNACLAADDDGDRWNELAF